MKQFFFDLSDKAFTKLEAGEDLLLTYNGEDSHFCRFNNGKIIQNGRVTQSSVGITLIYGGKKTSTSISTIGSMDEDLTKFTEALKQSREWLKDLPEDPFLMYNKEGSDTYTKEADVNYNSDKIIEDVIKNTKDLDFVGILAAGKIQSGFTNSFGQKKWFESTPFNLDWSLYLKADKATKSSYAGFEWNEDEFINKLSAGRRDLEYLARESKILEPGKYRVYLSPSAMEEVVQIMGWGSFGKKSMETKSSPLLKLKEGEKELDPRVSFDENYDLGTSAPFDNFGYSFESKVPLIKAGKYAGSLVSPRSAKEFNLEPNSGSHESPSSLSIAAGSLKEENILKELGTGIYISNLWYLNYSDRTNAKLTGMTRFASFWVEDGEIVAPVNVMRFDDSVYDMFGKNLVDFTEKRDLMLSNSTYSGRTTGGAQLPGALIKDFTLTL